MDKKLIIIITTILLLVILMGCSSPLQPLYPPGEPPSGTFKQPTARQTTAKTTTTKQATTKQGVIGSTVRLDTGAEYVTCSSTKENHKLLWKYLVAEDELGIRELITAGKVWTVPSGTKALVLSVTFDGIEVRLFEGDYKDKIAWVIFEATQ